ncbi:MAG TPA: DUF3795 domain-containing protein [Chitinivibrionales bacterium]|nr:DUF3795 domain-containing protein [Chitinivibrionales bacterium]
MKPSQQKSPKADKSLAGACGLFCPSCLIYIGARETPEHRARIAAGLGVPAETLVCDGCRSANRYVYCNSCKMIACVAKKGIDFCGQCAEYPCEELKRFQAEAPHRLELWEWQDRIRDAGWETWFEETRELFSCPECGAMNSAYNISCRKCGKAPGSGYAKRHGKVVEEFVAKRKG